MVLSVPKSQGQHLCLLPKNKILHSAITSRLNLTLTLTLTLAVTQHPAP